MSFTFSAAISHYCLNKKALHERFLELRHILQQDCHAEVGLVLMSDQEIEQYNRQYRNKTGPTNVLSFPTDNTDSGFAVPENDLGDILISVDSAQKEADEQHISLHQRLTQLIIHGYLHLLGYDHEQSTQEALAMWDMEQELFHKISRTRKKAMPKLAINVDHVATLRQARGVREPDPVIAAGICELAGAQGIVVHLREDRRHIQDRDVRLLRQTVKTKLNLEMAIAREIVDLALEISPDMVTLVPEKRKELTTEGGLDVVKNRRQVSKTIEAMKAVDIPVSLFIDPDAAQVEAAAECGATFVELHTGRYAEAGSEIAQADELHLITTTAELAYESGLRVNAGHGLDYQNTATIAKLPYIEELSIGHAVICRSLMVGLDQAVREMLALVKGLS